MIRLPVFAALCFSVSVSAFAADEAPTLNDLLDERIKANEVYRDDFAEEAQQSEYARELVPLEKKIGQEWVDYLRHVRESADRKLKIHVLRLELLDEIRGCYYDLEFAEGVMDKGKIRLEIKEWQKKVDRLNELTEGG